MAGAENPVNVCCSATYADEEVFGGSDVTKTGAKSANNAFGFGEVGNIV